VPPQGAGWYVDRTERFYKIDQLLKDGGSASFAKLQSALGVSRATLKRDLEYLRTRLNAPIEYDREANAYRMVHGSPRAGPRYALPGLWFSGEEVLALLSTLQLLGSLQPGLLQGQVAPLIERLRAIAGGEHSWEEVERRIRVFQPGRRNTPTEHFGIAAAATLKRKRLWIRHWNRADDKQTEREVSPQRLAHYRDNWYLDAYCHMREGLRSFAVDAIRDARLVDTKAKEIGKAELDSHLGAGYGIFAGKDVQWAKLRFSPEAARWVAAQQWHPAQRARIEPDGAWLLELPYAHDRELVMEVLKYGADVEVLAPAGLRRRVAEALREAGEKYR
jgi:predicted DNA-binding transcriptional regulator YafY